MTAIFLSIEVSPQASTLLILLFFIFLTMVIIQVSSVRQRRRYLAKLRRDFGKMPVSRASAEEFESIGAFSRDFAAASGQFSIDDTTWNDVGMDDIFLMANSTVSSCGEDVLWKMLRIPAFDDAVLKERDRLAEWFDANEKERVDVQFALSGVGRKRRMSQYEYICKLDSAERVNTLLYAALCLLAVVNIALFFIKPVWGVLCLFPLLAFNLRLQFKNDDKTRLYVESFNSVLRLLTSAKALSKLNYEPLRAYTDEMDIVRKKFAGFERGSIFVTSGGLVGDGPADAIMSYLKLFLHVDMLKFNQMLTSYRGHREDCVRLIELLGTLDACAAIASFRRLLPYYAKPEWESAECASMEVTEMFHPMIENPVTNSFSLDGGNLITGSNASGKSTFLKNSAICAILAQGIGTVPARSYKADFMRTMSSMALSDNLAAKESYFIVELKSIKRILDEAEKGEKVFCLVDEVLRGTNTVERIAASSKILAALSRPNVLAMAATHDIELTYLLEKEYTNLHFEETVTDDEVRFDYKLREGRATSRNAIRLLKVIGFEENIIDGAKRRAEHFDAHGVWE